MSQNRLCKFLMMMLTVKIHSVYAGLFSNKLFTLSFSNYLDYKHFNRHTDWGENNISVHYPLYKYLNTKHIIRSSKQI